MSRIVARETVFKLVFELCFHKPEEGTSYEEMLENTNLEEDNLNYVKEMYTGIIAEYDDILKQISENIKNYTIERLFKVDLAILIMSCYEMKHYPETSVKIIANEACELAKKYSTEKSYGFINAVIASIAKN